MNEMLAERIDPSDLTPGTRVEVRQRFDQSWTRGFEVAEVLERSYRLRRLSDGAVLPYHFGAASVRAEHRSPGLRRY